MPVPFTDIPWSSLSVPQGAIIAAAMTFLGGLGGVWLGQSQTSGRERNFKILQAKRETYIGALESIRALRNAHGERLRYKYRVEDLAQHLHEAGQRLRREVDSDLKDKIREEGEEINTKLKETEKQLSEANKRLDDAERDVLHWALRLEIDGAPDAIAAFHSLPDVARIVFVESRSEYVSKVRADLDRYSYSWFARAMRETDHWLQQQSPDNTSDPEQGAATTQGFGKV